MSGILIAVCGLDGAGKTTQQQLLLDWFQTNNIPCRTSRQPTDAYRMDERVRAYLDHGHCPDMKVLALLSAADRRHHMAASIEPALAQGISIISDRYLYSALAYFTLRGLTADYVRQLNSPIRKPDVTVFLDLEPEITLQRVALRDGGIFKHEEKQVVNFIEIREAFHRVLPTDAVFMDATWPAKTIHERIVQEVSIKLENLKEGRHEVTCIY